jgi:hypothetical protein
MRYEWDPEKDALNKRKHGLGLADGVPALDDPARVFWIDDRFDYGEERIVTLGFGRTRVLYIVCTKRGADLTRIISARNAEDYELEIYGLG